MESVVLVIAILLVIVAALGGWVLTLLGLPGNWLMAVVAGLYAWLAPTTSNAQISWTTVLVMAALAGIGELAELAAGVWGARRAGGSRRAAVFSLFGSLAGAVLGAIVGLPIPLLGPPLAAVLGGAVGALVGAGFAEYSRGEPSSQSMRVGKAAFIGRLLGTGAKTIVATILTAMLLVALIV